MSETELMKVRYLIAEARASSASRQNDFLSQCCDLWQEMAEHWKSLAPPDAELPPELMAKIAAFKEEQL